MPDEDIMDKLTEIDEDEILGEEVSFDDDLDFEGLDDLDSPPAAAPAAAPAIAPPSPRTAASSGEAKSEKPTARKSRAKPSKPKAERPGLDDGCTAPPATAADNDGEPPVPPDAIPPVETVTNVEEVVVKAKVLRIVADRVIIEPGNNISFSP